MKKFEIDRLAKVFVKYDFFNDEKIPDDSYGVLLDIYSSIPEDIKNAIRNYYFKHR